MIRAVIIAVTMLVLACRAACSRIFFGVAPREGGHSCSCL